LCHNNKKRRKCYVKKNKGLFFGEFIRKEFLKFLKERESLIKSLKV
jgi:hypothetical protein